jgi:hypothetical protein
MGSTKADNNSRKSRLRCGCQFPWFALGLRKGRTGLGLSKVGADKIKPPEKGQVKKRCKQSRNCINKFVPRPTAKWKKSVAARGKMLHQHLPGGTEEHHEESQSAYLIPKQEI